MDAAAFDLFQETGWMPKTGAWIEAVDAARLPVGPDALAEWAATEAARKDRYAAFWEKRPPRTPAAVSVTRSRERTIVVVQWRAASEF